MTPEIAQKRLQEGMPEWKAKGMNGEIAFFGGTFTGLQLSEMKAYLQVAYPYIKDGSVQGIRISTRPDCIDQQRLDLLKEYGVTHIELGVQSMDDEVLRQSGRGYLSEDVRKSAEMIRREGFILGMQMMPGLPADSEAKCRFTAEKIIACGAQETRIYPTVVLRGTKLEEMYRFGRFQPWDLQTSVEVTAQLKEKFLSADVTVLKVGLHSGTVEGDIVAGPYHSAFGQLVNSHICLERLLHFCEENSLHDSELYIQPCQFDPSDIAGQHRANILTLKEKYNVSIKIFKKVLTNQEYSFILSL